MKKQNSAFISYGKVEKGGLLLDESNHEKYPLKYYNIVNGQGIEKIEEDKSYYGFVYWGVAHIEASGKPTMTLTKDMYFSSVGDFRFMPESTFKMVLIEVNHKKGIYPQTKFKAFYNIGMIEEAGRLNYIDGCTDSLLIPPVKMGDPCFNHLHFPDSINQTQHTHPSHRIGIVTSGYGECVTPFGNLPLEEGVIFVIKEWNGKDYALGLDNETYPVGQHAFQTFDEVMNVIAFHPDSDFGATDINHPMINRTIVDGKSANKIDDILTK